MVIAVAIMGKDGYAYLKGKFLDKLKIISPDEVGLTRYRIGLLMFMLPLVFGFSQPYIDALTDTAFQFPNWLFLALDVIFVLSFFVLGGNFWDKIRGLFTY